jgi:hypothetical protein
MVVAWNFLDTGRHTLGRSATLGCFQTWRAFFGSFERAGLVCAFMLSLSLPLSLSVLVSLIAGFLC